jgi:hypothetical protein
MAYSQMGSNAREGTMKRSTILSASILAALVLSAGAAFAGVNYNASKSNTGNIFTYDPKVDLDGPKLCADHGGTIKPGPGALSTCFVPEKAPAPAKTN